MLKEINKAVETFHRMAFGTKHNTLKVPEKNLADFISVLTDLLVARYEKNWHPENPDRGSGYRCIRVNSQSIDPTIVESLKRANIKITRGLIVTELTIWVDPGVVSIRIGEDGSIGQEVVDVAVYNMGKQGKKPQGSEDGFSSRSSSPQYSLSTNSSRSTSPTNCSSPVPSKHSVSPSPVNSYTPQVSPSPPAMEVNPYTPQANISYPSMYQHPTTPLALQRKSPTTVNQPQLHGMISQSRPMIPYGPTVMSVQNADQFSKSSYINSSPTQRSTYSHKQAVLPTQENFSTSGTSHGEFRKMAFNPYHVMPMMYGNSLQQTHMYDISVLA